MVGSPVRRRALLRATVVSLLLSVLFVAAPSRADARAVQSPAALTITLPDPTGQSPIGTTELHLVDRHRADPWKPEVRRELMVSIWYPARDVGRFDLAPWAAPGVASAIESSVPSVGIPVGSVDWVGARSHGHVGAPLDRRFGGRPVVLFSPGLGGFRASGTILVEELASQGYVVVTIDHTFETVVEFPGGRLEMPLPVSPTPEWLQQAIDARVADTRFVLDQLRLLDLGLNPDAEHRRLPAGLRGAVDLRRVGMFGHSYGGFTTGETMVHDRRIDAGVNLDGTMGVGIGEFDIPYVPGQVAVQGLDRPFLLMGSELVNPETGEVLPHSHLAIDRTWRDFWAAQRGWKRDLLLHTASHNSYTDLQAILPPIAAGLGLPAGTFAPFIGTIDPQRSIAAQQAYVAGFFDLHLRHRDTGLFDGPSPQHPDVLFVE